MQDNHYFNWFDYIQRQSRTTFRIGQGRRSNKQDEELQDLLVSLCIDETIKFIEENYDEETFWDLWQALENSPNDDRAYELIKSTIEYLPYGLKRYQERINFFLSQIVQQLTI